MPTATLARVTVNEELAELRLRLRLRLGACFGGGPDGDGGLVDHGVEMDQDNGAKRNDDQEGEREKKMQGGDSLLMLGRTSPRT